MQSGSRATVTMSMRRPLLSELRVALLLLAVVGGSASSAEAQRWAKQPDGEWHAVEEERDPPGVFEPHSKVRLLGVTLLGGIPDGIAPGISVHPAPNLLHFDVAV